jgi:predicted RNA methylase
MKRISESAIEAIGSIEVDGNVVRMPQLERKLYEEVNKVFTAIGGEWDRKAKGHVFGGDPRDAIDQVVLTGGFVDKKQELGFFETPTLLAKRLVELADPSPGDYVLEPSAGRGAIARELADVVGVKLAMVDIDAEHLTALANLVVPYGGHFEVHAADFLQLSSESFEFAPFDRIVMNPPFAREQDAEHIGHALDLLAPCGRLVAIAGAGLAFRETRKSKTVRKRIEDMGGSIEALPPGSFKESGTNVNTVLVVVDA